MTFEEVGALLLENARSLVSQYAEFIVAVLLALVFLQTIRLIYARSLAARRMAKHRRLGEAGESRARKLLLREGYQIQGEQISGGYSMMLDGQRVPIRLRADFVVERQGRKYIAEVKSGAISAKVTGRATRRQLLEYLFAFEVDGVLLVNMHDEQIREVRFPPIK